MDLDIEEVRSSRRVAKGIQFVSEDTAKFFWYRFFFNVLERLQHTDIAKREIISLARVFYQESSYRHHIIAEFEREYRSDTAISWYTREYFGSLGINEALRSEDVNKIFSWRVFIQNLDRSLQQLRDEQVHFTPKCLFRGQDLHINDLNRLKENVGKLVTMTSFLSTSADLDVAIFFAQSNPDYSMMSAVLYRITVDFNNISMVCASIRHLSYFREEEEYLFSLRSLFRIDRIEFADDLWLIDLTAVDEDDQEFSTAINPWKATISEQSFFSGRHQPLFTRYLNFENSSFLAFQLLIDLMLRLDQTDYAREEMIEMCRRKYTNSPTDLVKIDEFEQTYSHQDAIKWYTIDSFLYRLLNSSLRLEDIDTVFKLRYYIYDLHNQLAQLQIPYIESLPVNEPLLTLYRGQRMKIIELEKLRENIGKLISMNSFLSTTNDVAAAVFFAGDDSLDNPETEISALYQIMIDTRLSHSIPFAKIDYMSVYEDEDEVLFSMASVFRIDAVEQYGRLWVVDLTLISKEDEEWTALTAHLND